MKRVTILADSFLRKEIEEKKWQDTIEVHFAESLTDLLSITSDAYFDFAFENSRQHITAIQALEQPVFISSTNITLVDIDQRFIRVNCWPGMITRPVIEIAPGNRADVSAYEQLFELLGWNFHVTPDIPGFISCRILATIINEAYYTLQQGVSSRKEIDTAMKLGTNYPYGPFEWADRIGIANVISLLNTLSTNDSRYKPAELLLAS